ncbi:kinase-like protein, partial [Massarina eburnea CBS 473.64]
IIVIEEGRDYYLGPHDKLPLRPVRHLGYGGSGLVEEVEDTHTGAVYARKTIKFNEQHTFRNEKSILRSLPRHRHIVRMFATSASKRDFSLIIEPVADEGDLGGFLDHIRDEIEDSEVISRRQRIDQRKLEVLQRAFGCLTGGLAFIHRSKIRHKDVNPQKILVDRGMVLYTDFGYSLDSSKSSNSSTTAGKPQFWTRRYSAPEVLNHERRNSLSDVFSLGCVYIDMLSVMYPKLVLSQGLCFGEELDSLHALL